MTGSDACKFVMPFGKHRGKTLRDIATDGPDGARYLDWMIGAVNLDGHPGMADALKAFLLLPWVAKLVEESLESREHGEPRENIHKPRPWWDRS
jgi:uncharacterized protein (DUF3820 family)